MARKKPKTRPKLAGLTHEAVHVAYDDIAVAVAEQADRWNIRGWSIVGSRNRLRLEVTVERTVRTPRHPVVEIEIPKLGLIKPAVRMLPGRLRISESVPFAALANVVDEAVAPGARIIVNGSPLQRAGIACIVKADNAKYLVTCGHAFDRGATSTGIFTRGHRIATLTHNFLEDDEPLDAAFCKLTPKGNELLASSTSAETWLSEVLDPADGRGRTADFFPSNDGADDVVTTTIDAYPAQTSDLHNDDWSDLDLACLIRTEPIATDGDSGSLLAVDGKYYGLCSGTPDFSYFTPIQTTIERIANALNTEVVTWHPGL